MKTHGKNHRGILRAFVNRTFRVECRVRQHVRHSVLLDNCLLRENEPTECSGVLGYSLFGKQHVVPVDSSRGPHFSMKCTDKERITLLCGRLLQTGFGAPHLREFVALGNATSDSSVGSFFALRSHYGAGKGSISDCFKCSCCINSQDVLLP